MVRTGNIVPYFTVVAYPTLEKNKEKRSAFWVGLAGVVVICFQMFSIND